MTDISTGGNKRAKAGSPASPDSFTTFGDLLKYLRRRAQLTQRELAIAVGYSEPQISYLEKNHRLPDVATVAALFIPALHLEDVPALAQRLLVLAEEAHIEDERLPGEPPYKGLEFFDTADADLFFGRELLTAQLAGHLREHHFLAIVVGASGSGKSSIVRAGLLPALKRAGRLADGSLPPRGSARWQMHVLTPGARPLEALAAIPLNELQPTRDPLFLLQEMAGDPQSFHKWVAESSNGQRVLLVVDQFEELFTQCQDEQERKTFIDNLLFAAIEATDGLTSAVITLRADFYGHCALYENLREALSKYQEYIGPMSGVELRRAIEEPAAQKGWDLEDGLVDQILRDVGDEPGALPLLSHALLETWKRRHGKMLTIAGYTESGGVRGAIAHTADNIYQALTPEQQTIARRIFLRLTELGQVTEDGLPAPDTRRRAMLKEITEGSHDKGETRAVLDRLVDARLVTLSKDAAEVAHEALIREWPRLRAWLTEDRERLLFHRQLTEDAREWENLDHTNDVLYRGARLAEAGEWAEQHGTDLASAERDFLDASLAESQAADRERQAQAERELEAARKLAETERRAASRLRRRALYLAGAFVLVTVLAGIALIFSRQATASAKSAREEEQISFVRELSAAAISNLPVDPERSILLSLEAVQTSMGAGRSTLVEAADALHRSVQASRIIATLRGHTGEIMGLAISPDGTRLATFSDDGSLKIWDVNQGKEILTLPIDLSAPGLPRFFSFSPDGKRLTAPVGNYHVKVWDSTTGKELLTLSNHTDEVSAAVFSPNGKQIATASLDATAKLWDSVTGKELMTFTGHEGGLSALAFSPDGSRLYTGSDGDGLVIVWDLSTGEELLRFDGEGRLYGLAVSPDGTRLATAEFDGTVKTWDATTGQLLLTMFGHSSSVNSVAFSADGKYLASVSEDGTAKVWDSLTGQLRITLAGHTSGLDGISFDPTGTRLYTASRDQTIKIWDISPAGGREWLNLTGHTDRVEDAAYSPDGNGKRIATGSVDGSVKIWDADNGKELITLAGNDQSVWSVAFSADGKHLAAGSSDFRHGSVMVWENHTGKRVLTLAGNFAGQVAFSPDGSLLAANDLSGAVRIFDPYTGQEKVTITAPASGAGSLAFSPDGARLAAASGDGTSVVWDVATGKTVLTLGGHSGAVNGIAFSSDGTKIATGGNDATVRVWDAMTGAQIYLFSGHTGAAMSVAFSPDGHSLASSSADRTVKLWDLSGNADSQPLTLYGHEAAIYNLAFSPDGTRLATASRDRTSRIYALDLQDLISLADSRLTRGLTDEECQKFLHLELCPAEP